MTLVLQKRPARIHAPNDGGVVGRGGADERQPHSRDGDVPDAVFVTDESTMRRCAVDRRGSFEVRHDSVGLLTKFVGVRSDLVSVDSFRHAFRQVCSHSVH